MEELSFEKSLKNFINKYCKENDSDTPDFILSKYLIDCLSGLTKAIRDRDKWYGFRSLSADNTIKDGGSSNGSDVAMIEQKKEISLQPLATVAQLLAYAKENNLGRVFTRCLNCNLWGTNLPGDTQCGNCNSMDTELYFSSDLITSFISSQGQNK